jgi:hypothetical protein
MSVLYHLEDDLFWAIALMMEALNTSETSLNLYQTARCNIPEDSHLHTRRPENLKSHFTISSNFKSIGIKNHNSVGPGKRTPCTAWRESEYSRTGRHNVHTAWIYISNRCSMHTETKAELFKTEGKMAEIIAT